MVVEAVIPAFAIRMPGSTDAEHRTEVVRRRRGGAVELRNVVDIDHEQFGAYVLLDHVRGAAGRMGMYAGALSDAEIEQMWAILQV